jgi:XapX domain-containing protein
MRPYFLAYGAGMLVGIIYSLVGVRSPAPPLIALVGLFGILVGEQVLPVAKRWFGPEPVTASWVMHQCGDHVLGQLPGTTSQCPDPNAAKSDQHPREAPPPA